MWQQILSGLTPSQLGVSAAQSIVLAMALWLLRKAVGKQPPKGWLFWIATVVALYLIITVTNAVVGGDKRPQLKGQILSVTAGEMKFVPVVSPQDAPKDSAFVNLVVAVSNTGVPSIATDYTLTVKFGSGVTKTGKPFAIPASGVKLPHSSGGGSEMIYREDHLPRKTIQPIPKGGCVQGLLLFMIEGASMQDLRAIGTSYRLEFRDLWEETYVTEIQNTGINDVILDWPGLRDSRVESEAPEIMPLSLSPTPNKAVSQPSPTSAAYP